MGFPNGDIKLSANFELNAGVPLDARLVVTNYSDLADIDFLYAGLIVFVTADDKHYSLASDLTTWSLLAGSIDLTDYHSGGDNIKLNADGGNAELNSDNYVNLNSGMDVNINSVNDTYVFSQHNLILTAVTDTLITTNKLTVNSSSSFQVALAGITIINGTLLNDTGAVTSVDWQNRFLSDFYGTLNVDGDERTLSNNKSIDWNARQLYDSAGNLFIDWYSRIFKDSSTKLLIQGDNRALHDADELVSIYWNERQLMGANGGQVIDWNSGYVKTNNRIIDDSYLGLYPIQDDDYMVILQGTYDTVITLPDATLQQGRELIFTHDDRGSYTTTLITQSSQLINGSSTYLMNSDYSTVKLYSTGVKWLITAN